ncbi:Uncharacterised protein [Neisseria meningitidis]|nr:Uncharacterised protein [Neisseria meningitidis]CWP74035.1 Uncharacterised protein [Neisseria meningitidis]CWT08176.1 Uncharacterised protein [Neisseria meningitidis]CWT68013.1 Uncharacterised protein [Neisseria meningitidis]
MPHIDARLQDTQLHCFVGDILNLFFIQQVQLGVQIIGHGGRFAMPVAQGNIAAFRGIDEVVITILFIKFVDCLTIVGGTLGAQIERHAQPRMILQFVNGRIVAAFVYVYIQPAAVCLFCQTGITEGKLGFIDKFGTACVASAYDIGVAVACQRDAGGTNPTGGIVALFQSVGIKIGNLAVGRQVGGCAKNGSTALSRNKLIAIVE